MASLEDFNSSFTPGLENFVTNDNAVAPVVNGSSNLNLATHAAVLSADPEEALGKYRQINAELTMEGKSQAADDLVELAKQRQFERSRQALVNILVDPNVSDEEKQKAANNVLDANSEVYNTRNMVSAQALEADNGRETHEAEVTRVSLAGSINAINDYKRKTQEIVNQQVAASDADTVKAFGDIFEMFVPFVEQKYAGSVLNELQEGKGSAYGKALGLLGSAKQSIPDMLKGIPVEQRMEVTQRIINAVNNNASIVMPDTNDYARVQYLKEFLGEGSYDEESKWIDNAASVLDLVGLGGTARRGIRAARGLLTTELSEAAVRDTVRQSVRSRVQPTTVSQNYKDTNPSKARSAHEMAAMDETGEAAEAMYGTSRTDAVGNDIAPEIGGVEGGVRNKVYNPEGIHNDAITPDADLMDFVYNRGDIFYDKSEKIAQRSAVVNDFASAKGLQARKEMFNVQATDNGVSIKAVYGPPEGGFMTSKDARDMAEWALKEYGIDPSNIQLLKRDGPNYYPVNDRELDVDLSTDIIRGGPGGPQGYSLERVQPDYLIQVNHDYKFSPADFTEWSKFDVKHNIFDRVFSSYNGSSLSSLGVGSLQRHLVDAASMFRPEITKGASVAVDRTARLEQRLLQMGDGFANVVKGMSKDRQVAIETVIREANEHGLDLDYSKLVADGFRPQEIEALKSWREYWDTVYHLENADAAKSLRNRGYKEFIDHEHDTRLFAKPMHRNTVGSSAKVFDHTTGEIRSLNKQEISELYDKGGEIAQLRQPMQVGDEAVELIVNSNTAGKSYMRGITDSTPVLAYRKGYYTVNYTDPHFIIKKVKDSRGNVLYEKAVATAKTKKEADILTARMAVTDGGEYYNRLDKKGSQIGSDSHWDIQQARGRSAQRVRGKRLEDSTSSIDPSESNIMHPVDALVHSARSISRRVEMRDFIDAGKLRALNQYEEFFPTNKWGQKEYPGNITEIQYRGGDALDSKKLADARSTFEYFKYLEDGYINHIDDTYKNAFKFLAEVAGNHHLSKAEKLGRWMGDSRGPAAWAKSTAFNLYLALNPLRQFVIQSHQAVQLFAQNPSWFLHGRATPQVAVIAAKQLGIEVSNSLLKGSGWTKEMADHAYKAFQDSGLVASIDKHNLVRGSLLNLADQTASSRARNFLSKPLSWSRKVGFDSGEYVNTLSSYLSFYDQAFRSGKDMKSAEVLENVAAESRNFTYGMNAAGDMPYNQNALSMVFQFMQVPHKAMMTLTLNRNLTAQQKIRLAAYNGVLYTLPPAAMYNLFGAILPEDEGLRDTVVQGLEGAMFNKLLSLGTGEDVNIDFSGLAPLDMYGTYEFIHGLFTADVGTVISSTPSGQLLFGNNPRLTNFAKTAARYFNLVDDYQNPTQFSEVAKEFAKLSSGMSNAFKASYALKYGQKINTMGGITDPNVSSPEAIAQIFGFGTMDETMKYYVNDKVYKKSQAFEKDVKLWYSEYKKHLVRNDITPSEMEGINRVYSEAWRHFGNDDFRAKELVNQMLRQDILNGDARIYQNVLRMTGMQSSSEVKQLIKAMPNIEDDKRKQLIDTVDFIETYKDPE